MASGRGDRVAHPLFQVGGGGSSPARPLQVKDLVFEQCSRKHAVALVREWHSRLPVTQDGPWQYAFRAQYDDVSYAVALWSNPSGRCLPGQWLELRRMARAPDAPEHVCSAFLSWMVRWFRKQCPERERCISYQDTSVHKGTIYKAAGWTVAYVSKPRVRDRSKVRVGTKRMYRWNESNWGSRNGEETESAGKVRWEIKL